MAESLRIEKANADQLRQVYVLIKQLAEYERMTDQILLTPEKFASDGSGDHPLFHCFVAILDNELVGYMVYYFVYSTFQGRSVFLEDIYVKEDKRGQGIGQRLYKALAKVALDNNCARADLVILKWNTPAINFHSKMGATDLTSKDQWLYCRVPREALEKLGQG